MDSLYNAWQQACCKIADGKNIYWKRDTDVYYMLEHVPGEYANVYLDLIIQSGFSIEAIESYSNLVDSVGNANRHPFTRNSKTIQSSTTCLRYLYHAIDIINKLIPILQKSIIPTLVEVGGGYGGLAVAINYVLQSKNSLYKINYNIIDLSNVLKLQRYYTSQFPLNSISLNLIDSEEYGANINVPNLFIISNYCLAEMGETNRQKYINTLFTKNSIIGGYLQWNSGAPLDFLSHFTTDVKEEYPQTGPENKTVVFYKP
jgi:hypothetical protein